MNCSEIQELFGVYFDLPTDDRRRIRVNEHLLTCSECLEEFHLWEESSDLIRSLQSVSTLEVGSVGISGRVMDRIYQDESWRMPVSSKIYSIPYRLRWKLTAFVAMVLAVFALSFFYSLTGAGSREAITPDNANLFGFHQAASASYSADESLNVHSLTRTAVASVSANMMEPIKLGSLHSYPDYWLVISILGLVGALLTMNWLSRTQS